MGKASRKKGGRVTPKVVPFCRNNPGRPCLYTSRTRKRMKGSEVWGEWIVSCSYCLGRKP